MKTIITVDFMAENFPAEVEFHYSESEKKITNVNRMTMLFDKHMPLDVTPLYFKDDYVQEKINEELIDNYVKGDYEEA
jgi:hypothetical protein